jgi:hypothetical protein
MKKLTLPLLCSLLFPIFAKAEVVVDPADYPTHPVTTVNFGEPLEGDTRPVLDKTKLIGNVVVVEEFGINVQDCKTRLKDLTRLAKKAERDKTKLLIVLIHRQNQEKDADVLEALSRVHPSIMVRKAGWLPIYHEGMPHAAVFNPDGSMEWQNQSMGKEFDRALKAALKKLKE